MQWQVYVMPRRAIIFLILADFIGPCGGVLEHPVILHVLVPARCRVLHLVNEVRLKSRMAAKCVDNLLPGCRIELPPGNLSNYFVTEIVPGESVGSKEDQ